MRSARFLFNFSKNGFARNSFRVEESASSVVTMLTAISEYNSIALFAYFLSAALKSGEIILFNVSLLMSEPDFSIKVFATYIPQGVP